ncbi:MAG: hydroxysteroid dehydrogenase-like protein 2, partial [Deltaproteobacteria bacterium]|nr:hydroxysteroid dehydrogenase-like protein 2 [Deltaproteobacteria bacterium]
RVDILINNAGILRDKSFMKMDLEAWRGVLDVHLNGAYHVTQPVFRVMREQGYGRIVMTTSAAGLYGNFGQSNYSTAKMGLVGLMNTLKLEGEKYNIKVNTVAPMAATRLTSDVLPPDLQKKMQPDYVAGIVIYLCSEACEGSGVIMNAGAGFFSRAAILTGSGTHLGDGKTPPTPENIRDHWEKINRMEGAGLFNDAATAVLSFAAPPDSGKKEPQKKSSSPDVEKIFRIMPESFNAGAAAGIDVVFQFCISGSGGGDWVVTVKDGACRVDQGTAEKPTTTIRMTDGDFIALITGKISGMQAYTSGKLKVEGDMMKAQLIEKLFTLKNL